VRVVVCGVGALGSHAVVLLRNVACDLALVDFDRVESKNLLAQAYVKPSLSKNKAEAMKLQLSSFWGRKSEAFGVRLQENNVDALCGAAGLVVDCFDNAKSRALLSTFAKRAKKPLVHAAVSADGTFGLVRWDERFVPDAEDAPGQPTCEGGEHLPLLALVAAALARAVQDFLRDGTQRDFLVSLTGVTQTFC
jgi:hypothetical protein